MEFQWRRPSDGKHVQPSECRMGPELKYVLVKGSNGHDEATSPEPNHLCAFFSTIFDHELMLRLLMREDPSGVYDGAGTASCNGQQLKWESHTLKQLGPPEPKDGRANQYADDIRAEIQRVFAPGVQ